MNTLAWLILIAQTLYPQSPNQDFQKTLEAAMNKDAGVMELEGVSDDPTFGSEANPIRLPGDMRSGPQRSRSYLNALRGPNGEAIEFHRAGSCCTFETENSELGAGRLDIYEITYEGLKEPIELWINFYDDGPKLAPKGFTVGK